MVEGHGGDRGSLRWQRAVEVEEAVEVAEGCRGDRGLQFGQMVVEGT